MRVHEAAVLLLYKETDTLIAPSHRKWLDQQQRTAQFIFKNIYSTFSIKMKCSLVFLLVGTIVAIACAVPSRSSLKAAEQRINWKDIGKRALNGLNTAVNGKKLAQMQQEDDEDDDDGSDKLVQALLDRIQEKVKAQDGDDEDALAQFIHLHFGK